MTKKKKIICGVAAGLAAFVLIALIVTLSVCKYLLDDMFGRVYAPEDYSVSTTYSDSDTGVERREIEFKSGGYEYDVDVDASTGNILKYKKDWD